MKKLSFLLVPMLFVLVACNQNEPPDPMAKAETMVAAKRVKGLTPGLFELTTGDAEIVASRFINEFSRSRSGAGAVNSVVTLKGADGQPAAYALNFDDGYMLISATKNLPPILGIVDHGKFSLSDVPSGRDVIVAQMIAEADYWRNNGGTDAYADEWRFYTDFPSDAPEVLSRAYDDTDPWYVQSEKMYELELQGYECYRITKFEDDQDVMPNSILERFKKSARFEDNIWEDERGEDFMYETAFIAIKTSSTPTTPSYKNTIMKTEWGQRGAYNFLLPNDNPLGCVTIAVGQIMKYHEFPNTFAWSEMPISLNEVAGFDYDIDITRFLKRLHDELDVSDSGSSNIDNAKKVLASYGYVVEKKKHQSGVYEYPTLCRGASSVIDPTGHAWVCDGESRLGYWRTDYSLYIFDNAYYPKFKYMELDHEMSQSTGSATFHMNWGWYGLYNGFYYEGSLNVDGTNYNSQREDLFITKP